MKDEKDLIRRGDALVQMCFGLTHEGAFRNVSEMKAAVEAAEYEALRSEVERLTRELDEARVTLHSLTCYAKDKDATISVGQHGFELMDRISELRAENARLTRERDEAEGARILNRAALKNALARVAALTAAVHRVRIVTTDDGGPCWCALETHDAACGALRDLLAEKAAKPEPPCATCGGDGVRKVEAGRGPGWVHLEGSPCPDCPKGETAERWIAVVTGQSGTAETAPRHRLVPSEKDPRISDETGGVK